MHITIMNVLVFFIAYVFILGVYQFIYIRIHKKGYELNKQDNESFFEFMCRYYEDDFFWKLRKKYCMRWIYNSKVFEKFVRLKGIILVLISLVMIGFIFWLKSTEYYVWLSIEL